VPTVEIAIESGPKRTFAAALAWPGWARSGRSEEEAIANLAEYAARYAAAVDEPTLREGATFKVTERLQGGASTDFGVPGETAKADRRPVDTRDTERLQRLLEAAWATFDAAAAAAEGRELRKGPRGGGRDLEKIRMHVVEADEAYLHQLGRSRPMPPKPDVAARTSEVRAAALAAFAARARGQEPEKANRVRKRWEPRYYVRRAAWHALDHAWELEDRVEP
jgi:hypothetical protein